MVVIAVTGKRGSGKDTFADYMKNEHGFLTLDFSTDGINPLLREKGLDITRENQIDLAMSLRSENGKGYFAEVLSERIYSGKDACISGMRFCEELEVFREKFKDDFLLISIMCDSHKRHERITKRGDKGEGNMTYEEFMRVEDKPTEKAIDTLIGEADYFIDNNSSLDDFHENIKKFVDEI